MGNQKETASSEDSSGLIADVRLALEDALAILVRFLFQEFVVAYIGKSMIETTNMERVELGWCRHRQVSTPTLIL